MAETVQTVDITLKKDDRMRLMKPVDDKKSLHKPESALAKKMIESTKKIRREKRNLSTDSEDSDDGTNLFFHKRNKEKLNEFFKFYIFTNSVFFGFAEKKRHKKVDKAKKYRKTSSDDEKSDKNSSSDSEKEKDKSKRSKDSLQPGNRQKN